MYHQAIVTFIDVLGFRELVGTKSADEVSKVLNVFRRYTADPEDKDPLGLQKISFSDSIIRTRPIDAYSGLFYEILDLLHAQSELIPNGILVRGGIACGNVDWSPDKVFGPGYIDAYELESKFAVYPRIVVSPKLLSLLMSGGLTVANDPIELEAAYVKSLLARGDDGVWFIDYLRAFFSELDEPDSYPDYLLAHKAIIDGLAERIKKDEGRLSSLALKANWLARYHNDVVDELPEEWLVNLGVDRKDLVVTNESLPSFFVFPPTVRDDPP